MADTAGTGPAAGGLQGAVALVTGGASGIGRATARRLAAGGARVAIVDLNLAGAEETARDLPGALAVAADVSDYAALRAATERVLGACGRVDVLVNNAGWDRVQPFLDTEPALWDRLIAINLKGLLNACHLLVPPMVARGSGRVVNVASDSGRVGSSGEAVYSACKGGTIAFTKSLAREVARAGVTVNCVCPGPTATPLLAEMRSEASVDRLMEAIVRATPTRRLAEPDEIAETIAFFAAAPAHITGQVLSVSGGLTMAG
ncbi:MAG TPA: SDR family NAD(P)-dependent oxidoreductase [Thermomicrobiales bacterium]|nr:SDR family NAD(P)-dependent oxidoreductase [Thermomicrobiales bacterium]